MKSRIKFFLFITCLIIFSMSLNLPSLGAISSFSSLNTQNDKSTNQITSSSTLTKTQAVNFTFNNIIKHNFNTSSYEGSINVTKILNQITNFTSTGTNIFSGSTLSEYLVNTTLLNITLYNNHNLLGGSASIYLNVWSNTNFSELNNNSNFYSLSNGQSSPINILTFSGWTNQTDLVIEVEKSGSLTPYLGTITVSQVFAHNQTSCYTTSTGDAQVCVNNTIIGYRTVTLTNQQIAKLYQPDLYISNVGGSGLSQTVYSPQTLYYRLLTGYDQEIGQNAIVIEYLYYWPNETDNFGSTLGHYYDFEPVYLYLKNIGQSPYRIVFETQNPGLTNLPAYLDIYSNSYISVQITSGTFNVSNQLSPLLGTTMSTNYITNPINNYYTSTNYLNISSEFPLITTPIMMVQDTYHNLIFGNSSSSVTKVGFTTPLTLLTDNAIFTFYQLLNQSFMSQLHEYSWNNYVVPYNLSLTLDMLYNPFTKPFIIDCFENVAHENANARTNTDSSFIGTVQLNTTVIIPATLTITYPAQVVPNSNTTVNLSINLDENKVLVLFNYLINMSTYLKLWFLTQNISLLFNGGISAQIPLQTISSFQQKTGLNSITDSHTFLNYITVNNVYFNVGLLGTIFNATIDINLYNVLQDLVTIYQPELKPIFTLLNLFIGGVDLELTPQLEGLVTGDVSTNSNSVLLSRNTVIFYKQNSPISIGLTIGKDQSSTKTFDFEITNLLYAMNFTNTWSMVLKPGSLLKYFVSDVQVILGTYPNVQWTVANGSGGAQANLTNISTQNIQISSTGNTDGFTIISVFIPLIVLYVYFKKKKNK